MSETQTQTQSPPPASTPPAAAATQTPPAATSRPEFIPEKFWDTATGAPRVEDLAKSYTALESKLGKARDDAIAEHEANRLKSRPAKPEDYAVAFAEGMLPADIVVLREKPGDDFQAEAGKAYFLLDERDPLLTTFRKTAHQVGMAPEQFNGLVAEFVRHAATRIPTEAQRTAQVQAELARIGPDGPQRAIALGAQLEAALGNEAGQAVIAGITTAPMLTAIEGLMRKVNGASFAPPASGTTAAPETEASLREKQISVAHLPDNDPNKIAALTQIEEARKRMYPGSRRA